MYMTDKAAIYANALDSDLGAERIQQVRSSNLWRGWIGTIYGCKVGSDKGVMVETKAEALESAFRMREQCREIAARKEKT